MNVIKKKTLDDFAATHTDAAEQLAGWRKIFEKTDFTDINAIRAVLPSADFADPYTIFNIKGNNYRLLTIIHYRYKRVFIKEFFTHAEYDRWNKVAKKGKPK
ncbi:MAG: type II toxin-antitoxin system HigB family toxin [Burkholderiales bacterium]